MTGLETDKISIHDFYMSVFRDISSIKNRWSENVRQGNRESRYLDAGVRLPILLTGSPRKSAMRWTFTTISEPETPLRGTETERKFVFWEESKIK